MSYTPTQWTTGDTITASAMNKIEQGIANAGGGGGSAIVSLSASGYSTQSNLFGSIVYGIYDDDNSRWVVSRDDDGYWEGIFGFANEAPKIIPPYLTVLPNNEDVGLFFVPSGSASVTGNISATNLYYSWGSLVGNVLHITGDGSITLAYQ